MREFALCSSCLQTRHCLKLLSRQCTQIPFLMSGIAGVSTLVHPGLSTGGCLWFPDLTAGAVSWPDVNHVLRTWETPWSQAELAAMRAAAAPMGLVGLALPTALWLMLRTNVSRTVDAVQRWLPVGSGRHGVDARAFNAVVR